MARARPDERHVRLCGEYAERLLPVLRARARELGYAIGIHGSLARDIDLIAVPWTVEAVDAATLAEALRVAAETVCPVAFNRDAEGAANPAYFHDGSPGAKPHGRRVWSFHLGGGPYIDLSVMPRLGGDGYEPRVIYPDETEADMDIEARAERAAREAKTRLGRVFIRNRHHLVAVAIAAVLGGAAGTAMGAAWAGIACAALGAAVAPAVVRALDR